MPAPGQICTQVTADNVAAALEAVPASLAAFPDTPGPDRPGDATQFAIHAGGNTQTIAAMTGPLASARFSAPALPPLWLRRLEFAGLLAAAVGQPPRPPDGQARPPASGD
jgi:ADP-ribosylglycohydrolase